MLDILGNLIITLYPDKCLLKRQYSSVMILTLKEDNITGCFFSMSLIVNIVLRALGNHCKYNVYWFTLLRVTLLFPLYRHLNSIMYTVYIYLCYV